MPATLQQIKEKVRKITRSPSIALLSESQLEDYINTFVLYDFPEQIRLFYFKTTLTFFTTPFVDTYETDSVPGLEDFKNKYLTIHPPVYVAGRQITLSQSRDEFFNTWPQNQFLTQIGAGDGITTHFSGIIGATSGAPITQNQVSITTVDSSIAPMTVQDDPQTNVLGNLVTVAILPVVVGTINYLTSAYDVTFPAPPGPGAVIQAQVKPYQASIPIAMLFYDTQFTFRPIPDKAYRITMDAFIRPTALLSDSDVPGLDEFWQYIAYGASKKVFEDRMDLDSVEQIMPEFKIQERLCLRRTIVQKTNQRTSTIYTNNGYGEGWGYNFWGYM